MSVASFTLVMACVDTVLGVLIVALLVRFRALSTPNGRSVMPRHFGRHQRDEERDWRERRGRFADCDPDTPDRVQIMPGRPPMREAQTHHLGADGIRVREDYDMGKRWGPDDDS